MINKINILLCLKKKIKKKKKNLALFLSKKKIKKDKKPTFFWKTKKFLLPINLKKQYYFNFLNNYNLFKLNIIKKQIIYNNIVFTNNSFYKYYMDFFYNKLNILTNLADNNLIRLNNNKNILEYPLYRKINNFFKKSKYFLNKKIDINTHKHINTSKKLNNKFNILLKNKNYWDNKVYHNIFYNLNKSANFFKNKIINEYILEEKQKNESLDPYVDHILKKKSMIDTNFKNKDKFTQKTLYFLKNKLEKENDINIPDKDYDLNDLNFLNIDLENKTKNKWKKLNSIKNYYINNIKNKYNKKIKVFKDIKIFKKKKYFLNLHNGKLSTYRTARFIHWKIKNKHKKINAYRYNLFLNIEKKKQDKNTYNYWHYILSCFKIPFFLLKSFSFYFYKINKIININTIYFLPFINSKSFILSFLKKKESFKLKKLLKKKFEYFKIKENRLYKVPNKLKSLIVSRKHFNYIEIDFITNYFILFKNINNKLTNYNDFIINNKLIKLLMFRYKP